MTNLAVLFSSATDEWATPENFYQELVERFGVFDLDPCCLPESKKGTMGYHPEDDGLSKNWGGSVRLQVFMNPPYGRCIGEWVKKAYASAQEGSRVVCLLPSRTDTKWWHEYCLKGQIFFIKGRLKFGDAVNSAPFPSAVVVFAKGDQPSMGVW